MTHLHGSRNVRIPFMSLHKTKVTDAYPTSTHETYHRYFDATICVHGDTSLMPPRSRDWAVANFRFDGHTSALSLYKSWHTSANGLPIFRSWTTHTVRSPKPSSPVLSPLYAPPVKWRHPIIDPDFFIVQAAMQAISGNHNMWFAGVHTGEFDLHESAVCSAVNVAKKLAPSSARLQKLIGPA